MYAVIGIDCINMANIYLESSPLNDYCDFVEYEYWERGSVMTLYMNEEGDLYIW
jgi:hypothetical protein